jgi:hypothetical protein
MKHGMPAGSHKEKNALVVLLVFRTKIEVIFIFSFLFEVVFHLVLRSSFCLVFFFGGRLSSWVRIRLHTENQLAMLSGSALQVSVVVVWCGGGGLVCWWYGPTHYFFNPNLELRLSWAVTI